MAEVQRVILKKIYVGKAAIFGLVWGAIMGLISALFFIICAMFLADAISSSFGATFADLLVRSIITTSFLTFIFFALMGCLSSVIGASVYNLVSLVKIRVHMDFMEFEEKVHDVMIN